LSAIAVMYETDIARRTHHRHTRDIWVFFEQFGNALVGVGRKNGKTLPNIGHFLDLSHDGDR